MPKPTIAQLEELLNKENDWEDNMIEILPNGEIRTLDGHTNEEIGNKKVLTFRENLGGEYA